MSSILKALKKLEKDSSTLKPGQPKIDVRILQEEQRPSGISRSVSVCLIIFFAIAASGTTYLFLKQPTRNISDNAVPAPPSPNLSNSPTPALMPQSPEQVPKNSQATQRLDKQVITGQENKTKKHFDSLLPGDHPVLTPTRNANNPSLPPSPPEKSIAPLRTEEPSPPPAAQLTQPPVRPALNISGIAFQEGSRDNLAVVNGSAVSKGAIIDGVKVEEVLADRVRFSQNGEKFEVILSKSSR